MKNLDKHLYRLLLRANLFLLLASFLLYPLKSVVHLDFLTVHSLLILSVSFLLIIAFAILVSIYNVKSKQKLFLPNISYYLFYHIIYPIIHKLFNTQSPIYEKYSSLLIKYNNIIQKKHLKKYDSKDILILLPHCLQNVGCPYKITFDINNCRECGKCVIQDFKHIQEEFNVQIKVATGGTLARKIVSDVKPKVILAVACHRDLTEGIKDIDVIPVVGVLNDRPNGPCFNTTCDTEEIRKILNKLL